MAEAAPTRFLRLRRCPVCSRALDDEPRAPVCPECGERLDDAAFDLDAADAGFAERVLASAAGERVPLGPLVIGALWSGAASTLLAAGQMGLALATAAGLLVHMGAVVLRLVHVGPDTTLRRLLATPTGVAVTRGGRPRLTRWHLFDEARIEPCRAEVPDRPGLDPGATPWKLTLVNAYKPSISTYLHRRGTDAAIFSPCVEFVFSATAAEAATVRARLQQSIDEATARYRALRLKEMDLPELDAARMLRPSRCPHCDAPARVRQGMAERCAQCRSRIDPGSFTVDVHLVGPGTGLVSTLTFIALVAAVVILAAGHVAAAGATAGATLLVSGLWLLRRRSEGDAGAHHLTCSGEGLHVHGQSGRARTLAWADCRAFRAVRLDSGQWRLAWWTEPVTHVTYAPMLFGWVALPWSKPALDVLLRGDERAGPIIAGEIRRRVDQVDRRPAPALAPAPFSPRPGA